MVTKTFNSIVVVLVLGLSLAMLAQGNLSAGPTGPTEADPGVELRVEGTDGSAAVAAQQMGTYALERAQELADSEIPLFGGMNAGGYPADYIGLVRYAWDLPFTADLRNRHAWSQNLRTVHAVEVPFQYLAAGDLLYNSRADNAGHALVFSGWLNPEQWDADYLPLSSEQVRAVLLQGVPFEGIEVSPFSNPADVVQSVYTLRIINGAVTVQELEQRLPGPYFALRSKQNPGYVEILGEVTVLANVKARLNAVTRFILINRGGTPVELTKLTAVAYGPNANLNGIAGEAVPFTAIEQVTLQPGQVQEYIGTHAFETPGRYIVFPSYTADGVDQVPMHQKRFKVTAN